MMRSLRWIAGALVVGCGVLYGQTPPTITSLTPPSAAPGTPGLAVTMTGSNFTLTTGVFWNATQLSATVLSPTTLTFFIPSWLLTANTVASIVAVNYPGNVQSNPVMFTVGAQIQVTTGDLPAASVGAAYSAALAATGGTAPYTWTLIGTPPPGLSLSAAGVLAGTPATAGRYDFTAQVRDAAGLTGSKAFALTVALPVLGVSTAQLPQATAGEVYRQTLTAIGGTAPYQWSATGLPDGLRIDAGSGVLSGTPSGPGSFSVAVQVSDAAGGSASRTLPLVVNPAALAITTISPLFSGIAGSPYSQTLAASGGVPPYRWAIVAGDPGGLTLDATTGTLRGTPQTEGTYSFTVQVTDSANRSASRAFSVRVDRPSLVITSGVLPTAAVGAPYNQTLTVTGGSAPYSWTIVSGDVPGLTLTLSGLLSGVPSAPGNFSIGVTVRDAAGTSATRVFNVSVTALAVRINPIPDVPDAVLNQEYSIQLSATGGAPPYTWSVNGLPEGLSVDGASGLIRGTPTAAGPFSFTARVTDSGLGTSVELFRLRVNLPPAPPVQLLGIPDTAEAAQQIPFQVAIGGTYTAPISGQAVLTFAPDSGGGDGTIQFASGGRTASFTIATGSTDATAAVPFAIQTGTVAGTITVSLRLTAGGIDITPVPAPQARIRIERAAPVISSARLVRTSTGISIEITGYSTSREITQMAVTFAATAGQTLQNTTVTVPVESLFNTWFQDPTAIQYGSQFLFRQPFTITGDANAVTAQSVTLTNRQGTATSRVEP